MSRRKISVKFDHITGGGVKWAAILLRKMTICLFFSSGGGDKKNSFNVKDREATF